MIRPASIVRFEQLYIGCWIVGLINVAVNWAPTTEAMRNTPGAAQMGANFPAYSLLGGAVLGSIVTLIIWYFIARKGSEVAKWIEVVLTGLGVIFFLYSFVSPTPVPTLSRVIGGLAVLLQIAAVYFLFQPDTKPWFGERPTTGPTTGL